MVTGLLFWVQTPPISPYHQPCLPWSTPSPTPHLPGGVCVDDGWALCLGKSSSLPLAVELHQRWAAVPCWPVPSLPTAPQGTLPLPVPDISLPLLSHCPHPSTPMNGCSGSCFSNLTVGDLGILPEPAGCCAKACSELIIIISCTVLGPFSSRASGICRLSQPALTLPLLLGGWSVMEWGEQGGG